MSPARSLAQSLNSSIGDFSITHLLIQEFPVLFFPAIRFGRLLDPVFRLIYTIMGQRKCIISLEFIPFCPIPFRSIPFISNSIIMDLNLISAFHVFG